MSNPHISFRLNYYQLAKALRILITLEPNQPIPSISQAMKIIIVDWISKHSINAPLSTSPGDIEAVKLISSIPVEQIDPYTTIRMAMSRASQELNQHTQQMIQKSAQQIQRDLEDEKLFNDLRRESAEKLARQARQEQQDREIEEQIKLAEQTMKRVLPKPSEFHDPNITESKISTVTDFSPPKDWIDQEV